MIVDHVNALEDNVLGMVTEEVEYVLDLSLEW